MLCPRRSSASPPVHTATTDGSTATTAPVSYQHFHQCEVFLHGLEARDAFSIKFAMVLAASGIRKCNCALRRAKLLFKFMPGVLISTNIFAQQMSSMDDIIPDVSAQGTVFPESSQVTVIPRVHILTLLSLPRYTANPKAVVIQQARSSPNIIPVGSTKFLGSFKALTLFLANASAM